MTKTEEKVKTPDKERIQAGQTLVCVVLEMAGAPKKHIDDAMSLLLDKLEKKEYIAELVSEEALEAEEHEKHKGLFTTIAEVELWIKKIEDIAQLAFEFMPASIEVIEPEYPSVSNKDLTIMMNGMLAKLHSGEMFVKNIGAKQQTLERNANMLLRNFIVNELKQGERSLGDLAKATGLTENHLEQFLPLLEKDKDIVKEGEKYKIIKKD